jgi:hypothetical protein
MAIQSSASGSRLRRTEPKTKVAMATGIGLLLMAVLAPFAQFAVMKTLIVPADAAATTNNIAASLGLFEAAVAAFLIVAILDVVVAWGFYLMLRPVSEGLARLVGSLRVVYAAVFAFALLNLVGAAGLVQSATGAALQSGPLQAEVASSLSAFDTTWRLALGIFGLHLVGLGALLFRFTAPRLLAVLVVLAGIGYLADSLGTIFVPGYALTISTFTFVGEALLIFWLFWRAARGSRSSARVVRTPDRSATATAS